MEQSGEGKSQRLTFRTSLGDEVEADADNPLSFRPEADGSFTPFVMVSDGLKARLSRPVYYELVAAGAEGKGGALGVWSGGVFFAFPAVAKS